MSGAIKADVVLAGGGLANSLIALRLAAVRPDLKVILLERDATIGGEHTWSHFASDVSPEIGAWLTPLIVHEWRGYDVRFPAHERTLANRYRAITSVRLNDVVSAALGENAWTGAEITEVTPTRVTLADGRTVEAPAVIDGRGARPSPHLTLGWQKFLGQELRFTAPHGLTRPTIMDATVPQLDGYRFLYVLPTGPDTALIEDTRYADGPALDHGELAADIAAYAKSQGWTIDAIVREENGILPIALAGDIDAHWREAPAGVPQAGLRAALFQPTTGYASPDAARLAFAVAALPELTSPALRTLTERISKDAWRARAYYRLLNRMLFRACAPDQRYKVLERFYRLPEPLIERFYAGEASLADKGRILIGKPPVPIGAALKVLRERSVTS